MGVRTAILIPGLGAGIRGVMRMFVGMPEEKPKNSVLMRRFRRVVMLKLEDRRAESIEKENEERQSSSNDPDLE